MEITHVEGERPKKAALTSLAIVGFVALIIIGILATIYAASFIPKMFSTSGSASAYLSGLADTSNPTPTTQPAPATTTPTVTATLEPVAPPTAPVPAKQTVTRTIYRTVVVPSQPVYTTPVYSGLSDLTVTVTDKGYLRNGNGGTFVSSSYVPNGYLGAVKYRISNLGTNISTSYRVAIAVDTNGSRDNATVNGGALPPNRSVEGIGSFDATSGGTATIRLSVDAGGNVAESNENNNTDVTTINVTGTSYNNTSNTNTSSYDSNGNYCSNGTYYSGSRYYCNTSSTINNNSRYDSNGSYCLNGTYSQNGRTYCKQYNSNNNTSYSRNNDANGNYCPYGVFQSGNSYYCNSSNSNTNVYYNNRDSACVYGSYQVNGTYYCY